MQQFNEKRASKHEHKRKTHHQSWNWNVEQSRANDSVYFVSCINIIRLRIANLVIYNLVTYNSIISGLITPIVIGFLHEI